MISGIEEQKRVHRLQVAQERKFEQTYIQSMKKLQDQVSKQKIRDSLNSGGAGSDLIVSYVDWKNALSPLNQDIAETTTLAANQGVKFLSQPARSKAVYDPLDPGAISRLQSDVEKMNGQVIPQSMEALSIATRDMSRNNVKVNQAVSMIIPMIGLNKPQVTHLTGVRAAMIEDGMSDKLVASRIRTMANGKLRERSESIAITTLTESVNGGRQEMWNQQFGKNILDPNTQFNKWITSLDERTCSLCAPMHGQVVRVGEPFSNGYVSPPRHSRCRCSLVLRHYNPASQAYPSRIPRSPLLDIPRF